MLAKGLSSTMSPHKNWEEQSKGKGAGAAQAVWSCRPGGHSQPPGHAPGGVALRHMLLNCFGSVLQKSSEVGRGEPGAALLEAGEATWL